jgi:hypothetical protein
MNRHLRVLFGASFLVACGGSAPPAESPTPDPTPAATARPRQRSGPSVSQELGSIDKTAVDAVFLKLGSSVRQCQKLGVGRVEYLSGDYKLFLRIGQDGKVKYGWLEESNLGDRATEKCLLDAAFAASWPKPQGGEAEVRQAAGFNPGDAREPTDWSADKIMAAVGANASLKKCDASGLHVTAYVEPDGKDGKVVAAGASASSKEAAEKIDCVVDALKGMKTPSPGSYAAKVSFKL